MAASTRRAHRAQPRRRETTKSQPLPQEQPVRLALRPSRDRHSLTQPHRETIRLLHLHREASEADRLQDARSPWLALRNSWRSTTQHSRFRQTQLTHCASCSSMGCARTSKRRAPRTTGLPASRRGFSTSARNFLKPTTPEPFRSTCSGSSSTASQHDLPRSSVKSRPQPIIKQVETNLERALQLATDCEYAYRLLHHLCEGCSIKSSSRSFTSRTKSLFAATSPLRSIFFYKRRERSPRRRVQTETPQGASPRGCHTNT